MSYLKRGAELDRLEPIRFVWRPLGDPSLCQGPAELLGVGQASPGSITPVRWPALTKMPKARDPHVAPLCALDPPTMDTASSIPSSSAGSSGDLLRSRAAAIAAKWPISLAILLVVGHMGTHALTLFCDRAVTKRRRWLRLGLAALRQRGRATRPAEARGVRVSWCPAPTPQGSPGRGSAPQPPDMAPAQQGPAAASGRRRYLKARSVRAGSTPDQGCLGRLGRLPLRAPHRQAPDEGAHQRRARPGEKQPEA